MPFTSIPESEARALLHVLRGEVPPGNLLVEQVDEILARRECGGYLHDRWARSGHLAMLPPAWADSILRAHRKTLLDNLAALAEFRRVGTILVSEKVPFVLLKGVAYLQDLYSDPGARSMTDLDLLVRRSDAGRLARRLMQEGFRGETGSHYPENRRFEMWFPGTAPCRVEFHWSLGLPRRARVDQAGLWERSRPCVVEEVPCRRLGAEDGLLYHVIHAADSYFGPSLKWTLDLREMMRIWRPDLELVLDRSLAWRCRTALHLSLLHLEKLFPGASPPELLERSAPGRLRARLLRRYMASDPLALLSVRSDSPARYPLRCLMIDRPVDALLLTLQVLARPFSRVVFGAMGATTAPWTWSD